MCITGCGLLGLFLCDHLCLKEGKQAVNCLNWMMMILFNVITGFLNLESTSEPLVRHFLSALCTRHYCAVCILDATAIPSHAAIYDQLCDCSSSGKALRTKNPLSFCLYLIFKIFST